MSVSVLGDISKDGNKGLVWREFESHGGGLEAYTDHDQWGYIGLTLKRLYKADLLYSTPTNGSHATLNKCITSKPIVKRMSCNCNVNKSSAICVVMYSKYFFFKRVYSCLFSLR